MYTLENDKIALVVNEAGEMVGLTNKAAGVNYAGGGSLWRLIYQDGISLEEILDGEGLRPVITVEGSKLVLDYQEGENAQLAFAMTITIRLDDDNLAFDIDLHNLDAARVIRECQCPIVHNCTIREEDELYWTMYGGQRLGNIRKQIDKHHTAYVGLDNFEVQMSLMYPRWAAMNYFMIATEEEGLYFGSHDDTFEVTSHYLGKAKDGINVALIKYPYLGPGEKVTIGSNVLSPYSGTWHVGAKKYRSWAEGWYQAPEVPKSIEDMTSWQRIILRHQYGQTFFRYDQLEDILNDGVTAGVKTLFMFGWHDAGHDAGYPDYSCDAGQGGFEAMKKNIKKFQDGGGKVIIYFNGRLIDAASQYYKEHGTEVSVKRPDGTEHNEFYMFGSHGTALRAFGNKSFVTACPSATHWQDILKKMIDMAVELGCDGVFFDQLGVLLDMCFDTTHGHKVPFTDAMAVNQKNLQELRAYTKAKNPAMSFGSELVCDVTAQHLDFLHTLAQGTRVINDWEKGEKPVSEMFLELFYYTFPEIVVSDREIRDDTDIERRVNFALMKGLRSDVEIYRCRETIAETPGYQAYLAKANGLREKYRDIILNGLYSDTDHFAIDNGELSATSFVKGDKLAVFVSQSHLECAKGVVTVAGYTLVEHDGIGGYAVDGQGDGVAVTIDRHGLALLIFEKA